MACTIKPKFYYADFPVTSATSPRQTRDAPVNFVRDVGDFPVSPTQTGLLPTCDWNFSNHLNIIGMVWNIPVTS